jgi:deoxyribodipyrimidine photo-lyase
MSCVLIWFRNDLRVSDQPALMAAVAQAEQLGLPLLPVYVWDSAQSQGTRWVAQRMGPHRRAWLTGNVRALDEQLQPLGSRLLVMHGQADALLPALMHHSGAVAAHTEALHAPEEATQAQLVRQAAATLACELRLHAQSTLLPQDQLPWSPSQLPEVFAAFRHQVEQAKVQPRAPLPAPQRMPPLPELPALWVDPASAPRGQPVHTPIAQAADVACPPEPRSSFPFHQAACAPGEAAAQAHLAQYLARQLPHSYKATRNGLSGLDFSSKFSPWLASGALSVPQIMAALCDFEATHGASDSSYWLWFELLWRDHFRLLHAKHGAALYLARGLSTLPTPPHDEAAFQRWCEGRTGEPLVDAGMRELAATGWLSNRMRQIVASYLIHELACDWRAGAAWFESRLIDFDVHSNQGNWLYIAGRGTDPRGGRRFNSDKQARDHDPDGAYRRLWGTA